MKKWNYVDTDGKPKSHGLYWVTLIYPERKNGRKTGRLMAEVCTRYFADLDNEPDLKGWVMDGEPDSGFAWTEECGSISGEKVHAWMPIEDVTIADLPVGVMKAE